MKVSSIAALGGIAVLASADPTSLNYAQASVCVGKTVTVTTTVRAGGNAPTDVPTYAPGAPSGGAYHPPPSFPPTTSGGNTGYGSYTTSAPGPVKTHKVEVGAFGQLVFNPNQVEAAVGDVVEFNFLARNHSVTQSNFLTPCTFNGGFDTGLNQFNPKNVSGLFIRSFAVKDTKPTWFYCKQSGPPNHCGKGMVFGINPAGKMDQFIENAKKQNGQSMTITSAIPTSTATSYTTKTSTPAKATTTVTVGLEKGKVLKFDPPFLQGQKEGDVIHFDFRAVNHTLTESSFDQPCKKLDGTKIDTNFQNVNPDDVPNLRAFELVLDSGAANKPRWFYCKQNNGKANGHCGQGMVFAINPESPEQFNRFLEKAKATLPKIKGRSLELGEMW